ncbi:hypothetical protein ACIA5D_21435 [Actinoplanes sp. NPDC051513]|uniref:hypothetical protein n=1 Tax=Actinoplanes sp. NPDC051513 TaxID=3363908 RepID=UPI0037888784
MTRQARKAPAKKPKSATARQAPAKAPSGWTELSKATKALVALVGTTAVAAVVPGVLPYVSDHTLDLFRSPIVDLRSEIGSSSLFLGQAATEVVATAPEDIVADPRFVPAGYAGTRLTLEGRRSAPVSVLDMSVEIVERRPPRRGTLIYVQSQGEGDNTVVDVDLDAPRPLPVAAGGGGPYFTGKHITLGRGELWVINAQFRTTQHEYAWRLHLRLRYRGSDREVTVPPADRPPFRMTAFVAPGDYRQLFVWNKDGLLTGHDCAAEQAVCAATDLPPMKARR